MGVVAAWRLPLLLLAALGWGLALVPATVARGVCRARPPRLVAPEPISIEEEEEEEEEEELVLMSTPLGNDIDLSPLPGPPVPIEEATASDGRPVFVCFSPFMPQAASSDALHHRYVKWLNSAEQAAVTLANSFYLMAPMATGDELTSAEKADSVVCSSHHTLTSCRL